MTLTAAQLANGSVKVQPNVVIKALDGEIHIEDLKITNMLGTKSKIFSSTIRSSTDLKAYHAVIAFYDVTDPTKDLPSLSKNPCRVYCGCKSFYFYFSWEDMQNEALYGRHPKPYERKTHPGDPNYKPPVNPAEIPGVCKHLILLMRSLRDSGFVTE